MQNMCILHPKQAFFLLKNLPISNDSKQGSVFQHESHCIRQMIIKCLVDLKCLTPLFCICYRYLEKYEIRIFNSETDSVSSHKTRVYCKDFILGIEPNNIRLTKPSYKKTKPC